MNYSLNFPFDCFSSEGFEMYDKYTKALKIDHCDYHIKGNYSIEQLRVLLSSKEILYVPCSTRVGVNYLFIVVDINADNIVTLEWAGWIK